MARRFKPPWSAERIPGGYVVKGRHGEGAHDGLGAARGEHYRQAAEPFRPPIGRDSERRLP